MSKADTTTADPWPVLFLMGPTASGKTDVAVALVRHGPFEIVSVDSAMVYRGLDIGAAKPAPDVLREAPHRLIDIRDPAEAYSAAEFRADALREVDAIHRAGRIPLLVGGTMLYFRALSDGLSPLPQADPKIRAALEREAGARGWEALHARLAEVDPPASRRIHPHDPQRIQRALEVYEITGQPMSTLQQGARPASLPWPLTRLALMPSDRQVLHQRIERRFDAMLEAGFIDEVARLRARGDLDLDRPAMRAVGYRQVWQYLAGESDRPAMRAAGIAATRQLAKRQMTWLRGMRGLELFDCLDRGLVDNVLKILDSRLKLG